MVRCSGFKRFRVQDVAEAPARRAPSRYRGASLIRNRRPLGPYNRTIPRALWGS